MAKFLFFLLGLISCVKESSTDYTYLDCRSLSVKKIRLNILPQGRNYVDLTLQNNCRQCRNPISTAMTLYILKRNTQDTLAASLQWEFALIANEQTVTYSLNTTLSELPTPTELQIYIPLVCVDVPYQP